MAKLNKPYQLSEAAQGALADRGVRRAAGAKNVAQARRAMDTPGMVDSVEDAREVSEQLSEVNRNLRAARRPRR